MGENRVTVLDADGRALSSTTPEKAKRLLTEGQARLISQEPWVIQLSYTVTLPSRSPETQPPPGRGQRILLHICCGPCAAYPIEQLRMEEFQVTGFWYNPNIQPSQEHEKRRESAERYAQAVGLSMIWYPQYDLITYLRAVVHHEAPSERCPACYQLRLTRTAEVAVREGFNTFTTTLLGSPHQDQQTLQRIGEAIGKAQGVSFYFENFRRGWSRGRQIAQAYELYHQQYCGCIFSEWERSRMSSKRDKETG